MAEALKVKVAPSILAADFSKLGLEAKRTQEAGGDLVHVDVMDGHFVPNLTIGPDVVRAIRKWTSLPLHTHLMIEKPHLFFKSFREAGADCIIFHVEVSKDVFENIEQLLFKGGKTERPQIDQRSPERQPTGLQRNRKKT